jgi:hypothetical protein
MKLGDSVTILSVAAQQRSLSKYLTGITLRVLTAIAEAFDSGVVVSKRSATRRRITDLSCVADTVRCRDIYYSDPAAFESQQVVDTLVDDLAYTIGVSRFDLNVVLVHFLPRFYAVAR